MKEIIGAIVLFLTVSFYAYVIAKMWKHGE